MSLYKSLSLCVCVCPCVPAPCPHVSLCVCLSTCLGSCVHLCQSLTLGSLGLNLSLPFISKHVPWSLCLSPPSVGPDEPLPCGPLLRPARPRPLWRSSLLPLPLSVRSAAASGLACTEEQPRCSPIQTHCQVPARKAPNPGQGAGSLLSQIPARLPAQVRLEPLRVGCRLWVTCSRPAALRQGPEEAAS